MDHIFEHLFLEASSGIKAKSFAEIREEHCKEGTEILRKVKQKLKNLPAENSAEFDKACPEIQDLRHDFLAISALEYRVVIWTLAKTFLWAKLINSMSEDNAASKHIDNADIDAIFPNVVDPLDSNAIVEHGSKVSNGNKDHKIGYDQQIENMKASHSDETLKADEKFEERCKIFFEYSVSEEKVCIIYDKRMLCHAPPAGVFHYERPCRISAIYKRIEKDGWLNRCDVYEACRAEVQDLLAAHSQEHVEYVLTLLIQFEEEKAKLWKKKRTLKQEIKKKEVEMPRDPDMYNSSGTADTALFAARGVIKACDLVARGIHPKAFAVVRPPGHHANRDKAMGFCYLNNIAVGAHYLLNKHQFKRILLVDWDVHHGNGTQDIFYGNSNVLFFSLHRVAKDFYPFFTIRFESDIGTGVGKGYNANICWREPKIEDDDFFVVWVHVLMPLARQFSPDIILISGGFDAATRDKLGDCSVTPRGFGTLLSELNEFCIESNIGLIMALEGGYNISAIEKSALACLKVLCGDKGDIKDINQYKPLEST